MSAMTAIIISEFTSTFVTNFAVYCIVQIISGAVFFGCAAIGYIFGMLLVMVG